MEFKKFATEALRPYAPGPPRFTLSSSEEWMHLEEVGEKVRGSEVGQDLSGEGVPWE